jgi:lipopolysaccharide transport system ATP-binding protein
MSVVIKIENISKAYQLGQIGSGSISGDLKRWWALSRGKEDPFLKIGESNDRTKKGESDIVWSLKDINLEIKKGEAVGIIGRNGAGKSTLLKILSRVTTPTSGNIKIRGRVASLLEVGTGFHPELTGRENIYLNGAILGMRKAEIKNNFDEIVNFSGVERYIDTPVKRYSSGMYVRLAFAVAAHLQSEILIVDEVLAVGDAEFQKKCLGKMGDISKGEGRTILFVSHNLPMIKKLCNTSILLSNGQVEQFDETENIIDTYNRMTEEHLTSVNKLPLISFNGTLDIVDFKWLDKNNKETFSYKVEEIFYWSITINLYEIPRDFNIVIALETIEGERIVTFTSKPTIKIEDLFLNQPLTIHGSYDLCLKPGKYNCALGVRFNNETVIYEPQFNLISINESMNFDNQNGSILTNSIWQLKQ